MGKKSAAFLTLSLGLLLILSLNSPGFAMDVTLAWDANTEPDLAGYVIYYDTDSGYPYDGIGSSDGDSPIEISLDQDEDPDPNVVQFTLYDLPEGTYVFTVTAFNTADLESGYSNEVSTATLVAGGTHKIKFEAKVWLQGEGTHKDATRGTFDITDNETWKLTEGGRKYSGEWRWDSGYKYIRIRELSNLRSAIQQKTLKPLLKKYVRSEYGASITSVKFKYTTYDITKLKVYVDGLGSFKIILKGKVSGKVSGKKITRSFKYEGKVTFL